MLIRTASPPEVAKNKTPRGDFGGIGEIMIKSGCEVGPHREESLPV
jgi:hypothetical protein